MSGDERPFLLWDGLEPMGKLAGHMDLHDATVCSEDMVPHYQSRANQRLRPIQYFTILDFQSHALYQYLLVFVWFPWDSPAFLGLAKKTNLLCATSHVEEGEERCFIVLSGSLEKKLRHRKLSQLLAGFQHRLLSHELLSDRPEGG